MFCDLQHEDRDHIVKSCYPMMIGTISEAQHGMEKRLSRGRSNGRKDHASFGRHTGPHHFKAFASAAPCCSGNKNGWCLDKRNNP